MSWLFKLGGQSTGASAPILPMNIQGWFLLGLTGLISWNSKRLSRVFFSIPFRMFQFFGTQPSLWSNSHIHTRLLKKPQPWLDGPLLQSMSLLFNMLSTFVIASLPRSKYLLILRLQSLSSTVILEPKKRKSHCFHFFPSICHEVMDWMPWN